jgi:hypothetical protein
VRATVGKQGAQVASTYLTLTLRVKCV